MSDFRPELKLGVPEGIYRRIRQRYFVLGSSADRDFVYRLRAQQPLLQRIAAHTQLGKVLVAAGRSWSPLELLAWLDGASSEIIEFDRCVEKAEQSFREFLEIRWTRLREIATTTATKRYSEFWEWLDFICRMSDHDSVKYQLRRTPIPKAVVSQATSGAIDLQNLIADFQSLCSRVSDMGAGNFSQRVRKLKSAARKCLKQSYDETRPLIDRVVESRLVEFLEGIGPSSLPHVEPVHFIRRINASGAELEAVIELLEATTSWRASDFSKFQAVVDSSPIRGKARELSLRDLQLVREWSSRGEFGAGQSVDVSGRAARKAEVFCTSIYKALWSAQEVEDVSIQQLDHADTRWTNFDIWDGRRGLGIDVKNALAAFHDELVISDLLVPRFKKLRLGSSESEVVISGTLSQRPWKRDGADEEEAIIWLGETSAAVIESLRLEFKDQQLILEREGRSGSFLAAWLFDYPNQWYGACQARQLALQRGCDLLEMYAPSALLGVPESVNAPLAGSDLACELARLKKLTVRVDGVSRIARPRLYLHVLARYCRAIQQQDWSWDSRALRHLLFGPAEVVCDWSIPFFTVDPLCSIHRLMNAMDQVLNHLRDSRERWDWFGVSPTGILRGRMSRLDGSTVVLTLLTHCGGWLSERQIRCGMCPLIYGVHSSCPQCGGLICPKCGSCKQGNCAR